MKINLQSTVKAEEAPKIVPFKDNTPSNWTIIAEGDKINAVNRQTLEKFEGSIQDFNLRLRG